jgi:DNA-binding transcriptional MerR regulator
LLIDVPQSFAEADSLLAAQTSTEQAQSAAEFSIDTLAREAGTTVRNVRSYQERGLLPPPERRGRNAIYTGAHLARLRVIGRMLERGYSLGNVSELIAAWQNGQDIAELLGLESALTSPWSDETPTLLPLEKVQTLFSGELPVNAVVKCLELGLLQPEPEGDCFRVPSMKLLQVGATLAKEGIPIEELLGIIAGLRSNVERVAADLVQLIVRYVFDKHGSDRLPPAEEAPHLAELVWKLRPMAMQAVDSEVARAMEMAVNRFLGERLGQILAQMKQEPTDVAPTPAPSDSGPSAAG